MFVSLAIHHPTQQMPSLSLHWTPFSNFLTGPAASSDHPCPLTHLFPLPLSVFTPVCSTCSSSRRSVVFQAKDSSSPPATCSLFCSCQRACKPLFSPSPSIESLNYLCLPACPTFRCSSPLPCTFLWQSTKKPAPKRPQPLAALWFQVN